MSIAHLLEDFGEPVAEQPAPALAGEALEAHRLEAFEEGYRAGWDDAVKAQAEEESRVRADLARNLQEMSFTYHEAYAQISRALAPLFERIADTLLPSAARDSLGSHVVEQLTALAREGAEGVAEVAVAPESEAAVAALLEEELPCKVRLRSDTMLGAGQAEITFGQVEREIDLDAALAAINDAIHAYFHETETEKRHG
jgi:flagellar assembly protein FliH